MKTDIHPKYFESIEIRCSCGNVVIAGSTKESLKTELCSKCHPFYTGQQKLVDTAGRVDKFAAKMKKSASMKEEAVKRKEAKKKKPEAYVEKQIPEEIIARASGVPLKKEEKGKWKKPIGDAPAVEVAKEEIAEAKKAKKVSAKKTKPAKVQAPKKSIAKPKTPSKKATVKKKNAKK